MSYHVVLPIWNALRDRFQKMVEGIPQENLQMKLGETTVGDLLFHTAEVEYMFAAWFFAKPRENKIDKPTDIKGYIQLLEDSNAHFLQAMKELPDETWGQMQQSSFGSSTPLEAVGRLMNHAGMHGGQIAYIQKYGHDASK